MHALAGDTRQPKARAKWLLLPIAAALALVAVYLTTDLPAAAQPPGSAPGAGQAASASGQGAASKELGLEVLSGRPDTVTGGDALVRVDVPRNVPPHQVRITLNGDTDVTDSFVADDDARTLTGLVSGMHDGDNTVEVAGPGRGRGRPTADLTLENHPIEGPVFSGPHQQPFYCETEAFTVPVLGGDLGPALDDNCSIDTRVDYFYRTTGDAFEAWPDGATSYPDDLATTETSLGVEAPYIVRMETGTVNRAVYQTTVLHDPLEGSDPTFDAPPESWNGGLIYTLGGGCVNGWYRQGNRTGGVTDDFMLSQGYAVASSSLNVFGVNCQDVTAAESAMMTKERFVERYGQPEHTIGYGCSGGSYQAHQIADNYPGIFDGIIPGCSFPEVGFGTATMITDGWLLDDYFTGKANVEWTEEEQRVTTGFLTYATAPNIANGARRIDPREFPGPIPPEDHYDPDTNPDGVRTNIYEHTVNVYGVDPDTGFARRPLDNVGIQYGLQSLEDGGISTEQFLDLNEHIGGFDVDANVVAERTEADLEATAIAYRTGRLTNGGGGLADIPIIDYRAYSDDRPNGDIHVRYHTNSMRERLEKANGTSANHVSLLEDERYGLFSTNSPLLRHAITQMDQWLRNIAEDASDAPAIDKVVAARPAALEEGCNTRDASPEFVAQPLDRDPDTLCEQEYPSASFPREVAGQSVAADVIKCELKPLDPDDYSTSFTDEEWERLEEIFPDGVCDYSKPGAEQQGLDGTWLRFD